MAQKSNLLPPFTQDEFSTLLNGSLPWKSWFVSNFPLMQKNWTAFGGSIVANRGTYSPAASYTVGAVYSQAEVTAIASALVAANARIRALEEALR